MECYRYAGGAGCGGGGGGEGGAGVGLGPGEEKDHGWGMEGFGCADGGDYGFDVVLGWVSGGLWVVGIRERAHAADTCYAVLPLRGFLEHDVCFILAKVQLGLFGCWLRHVCLPLEVAYESGMMGSQMPC